MSNSVNLALDVTKTGIQNPLIKVRQGDGGFETLRVTVTSNGEPLDLDGWNITFMGTTAGNHKIVDGRITLVEVPNGIFDYTPSKAWGMDIGDFKMAYFKFVKGDGSASSANFRVSVIEAVDLTQEEAQNYISVVDNLIEQTRQDLTNSLASVSASIATTSSAAGSLAVSVSNTASNAVNMVDATASSAVNTINTTASSAVVQVSNAASSASSVASSAAEKVSGVAAQVNSLIIGGRNYILNSSGLGTANSNMPVLIGSVPGNDTSVVFSDTGLNISNNQGNSEWFYQLANAWTDIAKTPLVAGNTYTLSLKAIGDVAQVALRIGFIGSTGVDERSNFTNITNDKWSKVTFTFKLPSDTTKIFIRIHGANNYSYATGFTGNERFTMKEIKLEAGNIATDWTPAPEDAPSNDAQIVHKTGTETIAGDKTFTGVTNIQNQKQYKASFTIGANTINLTRIGSIVYVNARIKEKINAGASYGVIPAGFTPANNAVISFIVNNIQGSCLFQADQKNVWFPADAPFDSNMSGSYLTSDALPS